MFNLKNREAIEWTNTWVEKAQDTSCNRILLIGDSVTREFRSVFSHLLPAYAIDFIGMSFSLEDDMLYSYMKAFFAATEYKYKLCFVNIGAKHGYYLDTKHDTMARESFETAYTRLVDFVKTYCSNIVILSVTPSVSSDNLGCWDTKINEEILQRNNMMLKIAQSSNFPYIDIYAYCVEHNFKYRDSQHFANPKNQYDIVHFILNALVNMKKIPQKEILPPLEKKFWGLYKKKNNLKQIKTKFLFGFFTKLQENEQDSYYLLGICIRKKCHSSNQNNIGR